MDAITRVMDRLNALGNVSEEKGRLTRRFATPSMRQANEMAARWMREAGMTVRQDALGNLFGHYAGATPDAKILMLGSHLDTVPNAGKFDGALGVVLAIACIEELAGSKLPFAIEVAAFADEEGVRFQTSYLGSGVVSGAIAEITRAEIRDAIREFGGDADEISTCRIAPERLLGYAEVHIEQGPVLEQKNLAVGVVTGIAGQTRANIVIQGKAGHAGTTPMRARRDALCAAARFILEVEDYARKRKGLVATVGRLEVLSGAVNVIPGQVTLTLDVRHAEDAVRLAAVNHFKNLPGKRDRSFSIFGDTPAVHCSAAHTAMMRKAVRRHQSRVVSLTSGAGHDAAMMARIMPVSMLFVRCKDGISHHPEESVQREDVRIALGVLKDYVNEFV